MAVSSPIHHSSAAMSRSAEPLSSQRCQTLKDEVIIKIGSAIPRTAGHKINCIITKCTSGFNTALQAPTQIIASWTYGPQQCGIRNRVSWFTLRHEIHLNYIQTRVSYLAVNTMHLPANAVQKNNFCCCHITRKKRNTFCEEMRSTLNVNSVGTIYRSISRILKVQKPLRNTFLNRCYIRNYRKFLNDSTVAFIYKSHHNTSDVRY